MEFLQVIPIHHCQSYVRECCDLINSEWPRSITARCQTLFMSSENFPTSLVLILNDCQVVGHVKLTEIRYRGPEVMLESMIIHKDHRRKGWGMILMEAAEKFVERRGKKKIYLSTKGQEGFYTKLGYKICEPILYFGFCDLTPKDDEKVEKPINLNPETPKLDLNVPPPPPMPTTPKNHWIAPPNRKTSKTYMSKNLSKEEYEDDSKN